MNDKIKAKIGALLQEVYTEGVKDGRHLARDDLSERLLAFLSAPEKKNGQGRKRGPRKARPVDADQPELFTEDQPRTIPTTAPTATVNDLVASALASGYVGLDGIDPDTLTTHIRERNHGLDINVREVRGILRTMTLSGAARRIGRGRYIAATMHS